MLQDSSEEQLIDPARIEEIQAASWWYVIHTKPRQESRALLNLVQQEFECYMPQRLVQQLKKGTLAVKEEPLFPRYFFIRLQTHSTGKSWAPIRSTLGVSRLLTFGTEPARVDDRLIDYLRLTEARQYQTPEQLYKNGDTVEIVDGPFAGIQALYQMADGESRAIVLIDILNKLTRLKLPINSLTKVR
jgi:transcriptional antiterminator RfaH